MAKPKARIGQFPWLLVLLAPACVGAVGSTEGKERPPASQAGGGAGGNVSGPPSSQLPFLAPKSGIRRLSRDEYDNTLSDLLGDARRPGEKYLPLDIFTPFDNEYPSQEVSPGLIDGTELLATEAAAHLVADTKARAAVVGCVPSGPGDKPCLRSFITRFGRRALRRPLSSTEVDEYMALQSHAVKAGDFFAAVSLVVNAMLQDPEFLYRIETGTADPVRPGVFKLGPFELASRLSYTLWGSGPDDALLDAAAAGKLNSSDDIRNAVVKMIKDPRAVSRVKRFHAMWFGYHQIPLAPELAAPMRAETDALVERVVFTESKRWTDLFTEDQTFISDDLAAHYGLPLPGSKTPKWVSYTGSGRRGILSHGSFLSLGSKGDTSPTQRGLLVRQRLGCQDIPPPPPNLQTDEPPTGPEGSCKVDRYREHADNANCRACHELIDPVGFGLENFDTQGRFRNTEAENTKCTIDGSGNLAGVGTFRGPAELGERLVASEIMEACLVKRTYRFVMGRPETEEETAFLDSLTQRLKSNGQDFLSLLVDISTSAAFAYRQPE